MSPRPKWIRMPHPPPPLPVQLADELARITHGLLLDRAWLLQYWRSLRERGPLLDALRHDHAARDAAALLTLRPDQLARVEEAYAALDALALWARWTEDMPTTLEATLDDAVRALQPRVAAALRALDGRPPPWDEAPTAG